MAGIDIGKEMKYEHHEFGQLGIKLDKIETISYEKELCAGITLSTQTIPGSHPTPSQIGRRTEKLAMAVLLKNLMARTPKIEDLVAVKELVAACDIAEYGLVGSTMEDLASNWQRSEFNLATDAWVIVTNKGQVVGFACVWHKDYVQIDTFVCVHPEYRGRGIGTLLLRLVEERARQHARNACSGSHVTLNSTVSSVNEGAKRLFEREGYTPARQFWQIAIELDESSDKTSRQGKLELDLDVESQHLVNAAQLYDRDAVYVIRQYYIYEKELRAGDGPCADAGDEPEALVAIG
jgi:ribosomal protein S18 acetylase RimI-like enzyme